ncbi:hypothetical protein Rsub_07802 [Raphidocelis subcapitata]|uniref:Uncharacterized protein n=1 Tax=Raphidocelis subcapitata TaxID=307507 RepID=A0A2V0P675_9CHLO|nr:hypothetical protein Rsub_07802 [Raphidocelis subcapitata]|eukprot:GBF95374.1 hypothetical protein Rsub_07802 [Raphidocelis subcapitata]
MRRLARARGLVFLRLRGAAASQQRWLASPGSGAIDGGSGSGGGAGGSAGGGGGPSRLLAVALLALPAGAYLSLQQGGRQTSSAPDGSLLVRHDDADEFKTPPAAGDEPEAAAGPAAASAGEHADGSAPAGAADGTAARAGDDYGAAADEFPGTSPGDSPRSSEPPLTVTFLGWPDGDDGDGAAPRVHVDTAPIEDLLRAVYGDGPVDLGGGGGGELGGGDADAAAASASGVAGEERAEERGGAFAAAAAAAASAVAAAGAAAGAAAAGAAAAAAAAPASGDQYSGAADEFPEALAGGGSEHRSSPVQPPQQRQQQPPPQPPAASRAPADLSPSGLVAAAAAVGYGPREDWAAAAAQLRQATADAAAIQRAVEALEERNARLVAELEGERAARAAAELEARQRADALAEEFRALQAVQHRAAERLQAEAVRAAEERVAADAARHLVEERTARVGALDALRQQVNALAGALSARGEEAEAAAAARRRALGALHMARALEEGRPLPREVLRGDGAREDAVVAAVADALPPAAASAGLPSRAQLADRFEAVAREAARQALLPPGGGGGVLAHAAAWAAVALKIPSDAGGSGAAAIEKARAHLRAGRLAAAAEELSAAAAGAGGGGAAAAAGRWAAEARARAVADQSVRLLRAHAASQATAFA